MRARTSLSAARFLVTIGCAVMLQAPAGADSRSSNPASGGDPRGEPELTVCSQNLQNFGTIAETRQRTGGVTPESYRTKQEALVARFLAKKCDVIGVQEVLGDNEQVSLEGLQILADLLRKKTGRTFIAKVGSASEGPLHNGFLVASDRAEILNVVSYQNVELPKISLKQKPRFFGRSPIEIQLSVKPRGEGAPKLVNLVDFHFKSKHGGSGDPAELEWETYRMEMAEALRRVVERRHAASFANGDTILILMGDRNGNSDVASAKILEGSLALSLFQGKAACRLSKRGVPLCQGGTNLPQRLFSVISTDPETKLLTGTFHYKDEYSWLDDILMPAESLRYAWTAYDTPGNYNSDVLWKSSKASDHAMVSVTLNW